MSQIVLDLPQEVDEKLRIKAEALGIGVEEYLLRLAINDPPRPRHISQDEYLAATKELNEFLATVPSLQIEKHVDDSRESIY